MTVDLPHQDSGPLFPDDDLRHSIETRLRDVLTRSIGRVGRGKVTPAMNVEAFREELAAKVFDEQEDLARLLDWTIGWLERGLVQTNHPRYFGLYNPAPSFPAICADQVAAAFNPQICVWSHAPVAVEIETHVVNQVARRAALPMDAGGHFTSGGSEANSTAAICAFTSNNTEFSELGVRAFGGAPRIYASADSHLAWLKIAHQLGVGRSAVRLVSTDGKGRMDPVALEEAILTDMSAGDVPVMVAATAGTTNAGVVDPLHPCADIAKEHGLWFHVDAAWGGALLASDKYRHVLTGIERADSITIDAHKWFASTMGAGMFLVRQRAILNEAFRVSTEYMPSNDAAVDLYVNSVQWSRRFVGLRMFLSLGVAGWEGYATHVERAIDLIDRLSERLTSKGWTRANDSKMAVACLVPPPSRLCVDDVVSRVVTSGESWISATTFEGQRVIRVCATNGRTTTADADHLENQLIRESAVS